MKRFHSSNFWGVIESVKMHNAPTLRQKACEWNGIESNSIFRVIFNSFSDSVYK